MARGVLGRDFYSILDDNFIEENRDSVKSLRVSDIEPRKGQPRKSFDDESLQLLADSIAIHGVLQPIIVRENHMFPGTYEIIAGERRWRASKMAGLTEIPVIIVDGNDLKIAQISLVENVQREDLNAVEEALAYKELAENFGLTQEQISKEVGKSRSSVANMLRLLDLPDEVLELIKEDKLSMGHAKVILGLENEEMMINVANKVVETGASVRETEVIVKKAIENKDKTVEEIVQPDAQRRVYMRSLEVRAMEALGRKVKINSTKKKTVEFTYDSDDDLAELLTLVCGDKFFSEK